VADRTVHGRSRRGEEIVRYGRAGKWYIEGRTDRLRVTVAQAAAAAAAGEFYPGLPGGRTFDAEVRAVYAWRRRIVSEGGEERG
jgi:hypothetical protein